MANVLRIKRTTTNNNPSSLANAELAFVTVDFGRFSFFPIKSTLYVCVPRLSLFKSGVDVSSENLTAKYQGVLEYTSLK